MSAKILISAPANSGKTTLLSTLTDVLVVAIDGKKYPFPQPHINVAGFETVSEFTALINAKVGAYQEKFGELPKTVAIDSVSRVFETISDNCNRKYSGFNIYTELNKEVKLFTDYIEDTLVSNGVNVVIVSHAVWNPDTAKYDLVAQGSFAKAGGFLAVVDNAIFLEVKSNKRIVYHKSPKFLARSVLSDLEESQAVEDYNLQHHIDQLNGLKSAVDEFTL